MQATYAIIQSGGSQYRVETGQHLKVDRLDRQVGSQFQIKEVLAIGGSKALFGDPYVSHAKVEATVQAQARGPKILVFKKQRRKRHRRLKGHRQSFTEIKIDRIILPEAQ